MNKVFLVGRLTRDPELRTLPSGKAVATFVVSTNEFRGGNGSAERRDQLVDVEGRLQTREWDDDAGIRHWKTEVVAERFEMLSGRAKREAAVQLAEAEMAAV
jgi:single-strand DNA-binding protein